MKQEISKERLVVGGHDYEHRQIWIGSSLYLWGRANNSTDILDENGQMLFTVPKRLEEKEVRLCLYSWLQREVKILFEK